MISPVANLAQPPARAQGLSAGNFRKIAVNGFGDPHNSYAWGCCYFRDHVYIGTARDMLVMVAKRFPYDLPMPNWPVELPNSHWDSDLRGQVWRYGLASGQWERIYLSPLVEGNEGRTVPLAHGFRNMNVFQGTSDAAPAIYSIPGCESYGKGPVLLRSSDGDHFEQASKPGMGLNDPNVTSFRGLIPFKGLLFTTPAGSRNAQGNVSQNSTIICNSDPTRAAWTASNEPAFGDPTNQTIFDLGVCGDYLYAGTINIRHGFQVWKSRVEGPPPHRWTKVMEGGAARGQHNQMVMCFAEFRGAMYFGTGIQNGGHDRQYNVGRAAGEIIRLWPDDSWDLVMGEPRVVDQGAKFPTSGHGPGFDNFFNGYIWRLVVHDDVLYVGTFNAASFLTYSSRDDWPDWLKRRFTPSSLEQFLRTRGGAELWRTSDGDNWTPITRTGLDNICNYGIRSLLTTPHGLFVGTANPFGPRICVNGPGGWRYEDNPQGGVEVWHGTLEHKGGVQDQGGTSGPEGRTKWMTANGATPESAVDASISRPLGSPVLDDLLGSKELIEDSIFDESRMYAVVHREETNPTSLLHNATHDAAVRLSRSRKDLCGALPSIREEVDEFFGPSGPQFVGFWRHPAATPQRACIELLNEIAAIMSKQCESPACSVLVLGQSSAVVAEHLLQDGAAARATAIFDGVATSDRDSDVRVVPARRAGWALKRGQFDCIVWLEGPNVGKRQANLRQATRWLAPGGVLLATDLVIQSLAGERKLARCDQESYERDLRKAELRPFIWNDITSKGWVRFFDRATEYYSAKLLLRQIDRNRYKEILRRLPGGEGPVEKHIFIGAKKELGASES